MKKTLITLLLFLLPILSFAKVKLPKIIGDNMVLQRNTEVNLWGTSDSKKDIVIKTSWNNKLYTTRTNVTGEWLLKVQTEEAGGPYSISISDGDELVLRNIFLGEVWICSGQSNMEFPVCGFINQYNEGSLETIKKSIDYPNVRLFTVERHSVDTPQTDCKGGEWLSSSYASVSGFSAVAYYFGRMLNEALDVPIGLITPNWGGSRIESWMTEKSIRETAGIDQVVAMSGKCEASKPAVLYNGMIHPLINFTSKGFIWYQGESNRDFYFDYKQLMKSMIYSWRSLWGNDKMPFYFVQLAPYNYDRAELRSLALTVEAQTQVLNEVPYTGMAATTDLGHPRNIHPPKKQEVGERLAFLALKNDYGIEGLPNPAPAYESMEIKDSTIVISFTNLSLPPNNSMEPNSLVGFSSDGIFPVLGFEIAGDDQVFYPARGRLIWWENKIEVSADEVKNPVAVRYAFKNYPEANVQTTFGIPLIPFRTDKWKIPTGEIFKPRP